ncbi:MAG: hypothetical protein LBR51_04965 [Bacteroidales bacterium]|jgi:hypothetical protein|nr:hypothetical protein [Bacteroidales bacterium]
MLKRILVACVALLILCAGIWYTASRPLSPETTLARFAKCWYKGNLEKAMSYVNEHSKTWIALLIQGHERDAFENMHDNKVKVIFLKKDETSDTTMIYHCLIQLNEDTLNYDFHLDKEDKKWKVNIIR